MFTVAQFDAAVQKFLVSEPRLAQKYNSASLVETISKRMQSTSLPSVTAARIALDALIEEGKIVRTDGHDAAWDAAEYQDAVNQTVAKCVEQDIAEPLQKWEIEWFSSLSADELRTRYFENGGLNKFHHRYDLAVAQAGFVAPLPVKAQR
jgi:hypothetical protein